MPANPSPSPSPNPNPSPHQGVCQLFIFNEIFPLLFGVGTDWQTVTAKALRRAESGLRPALGQRPICLSLACVERRLSSLEARDALRSPPRVAPKTSAAFNRQVLTDQFVLTPLVCLPVAYVFKAVAFRYGVNEGLRRYLADAQRDLLLKYWLIWGPVQCLTFSVVPAQWRIPFIACVSFVWTFILSSISSRDDAKRAATEAT